MKKLILLTLLFVQTNSYSQTQQVEIDTLQKTLKTLEQKLDARERELIEIKKNQNTIYEKMIDVKQKTYQTESELWKEHFGWFSGFLTFVSAVLGLFIGWLGLKKYFEKKADEIFDKFLIEKFKEIKESDITTLYNEIESAAWKAQIRTKKILILNQKDTVLPDDFNTALKVFNPKIKQIKEPKDAIKIDYSKYALVVLENYENVGFWDLKEYENDLIELTNKICGNGTAFIYYGNNRKGFYPETNVNKHLVNFANSPSQLYNNVMNTLKFQDLLKNV